MADQTVKTTSTAMTSATATSAPTKSIWVKQVEDAKLKSEAEKTAATFKEVDSSNSGDGSSNAVDDDDDEVDDDEDEEERERKRLARKTIVPVDPTKCTATGSGIGGGTAGVASTLVVVTKYVDGRKVPNGGAQVRIIVSPGVGVGGSEQYRKGYG